MDSFTVIRNFKSSLKKKNLLAVTAKKKRILWGTTLYMFEESNSDCYCNTVAKYFAKSFYSTSIWYKHWFTEIFPQKSCYKNSLPLKIFSVKSSVEKWKNNISSNQLIQ